MMVTFGSLDVDVPPSEVEALRLTQAGQAHEFDQIRALLGRIGVLLGANTLHDRLKFRK